MLYNIGDEVTIKVKGKLTKVERGICSGKIEYTFVTPGMYLSINEEVLEKQLCEKEQLAEA